VYRMRIDSGQKINVDNCGNYPQSKSEISRQLSTSLFP
jgi:hypothetical protein